MLTSANYIRDEAVILSGEEIAMETDFTQPGIKIYRSSIIGCRTHLPDGAEIRFYGGVFATANPEIQAYLDKVANKRGSIIFTDEALDQQLIAQAQAAAGAALPAGDAKSLTAAVSAELAATVAQAAKPLSQDKVAASK